MTSGREKEVICRRERYYVVEGHGSNRRQGGRWDIDLGAEDSKAIDLGIAR